MGTINRSVQGATGLNCVGNGFHERKLFFRRKVSSDWETAYSNVVSIDIAAALNAGIVNSSQVIQSGTTPVKLANAVSASGGSGTYTYQWESSTDESIWSAIPGASSLDYQPGAQTKNIYYRRKVTSGDLSANTNSIQILIKAPTGLNVPDGSSPQATQTKILPPNYSSISGNSLNSVKSYTIYKPGVNVSQLSTLSGKRDISVSTIYTDGLKRPLEVVQQEAGNTAQDMVELSQYDQFGREMVEHLPYLANTNATNKGQFRTDGVTAQPAFYNTLTQNQQDFFYEQLTMEESPSIRYYKNILPGKSYSGSTVGDRVNVKMNDGNEHVRAWKIGSALSDLPFSTEEYETGTLMVESYTDVNELKVTAYKDRNGRLVMKSSQGINGFYQNELRTYYVYDDLGNLRYVIPPLATKGWWNKTTWDFASTEDTKSALQELGYKYFYDKLGRLIIQEKAGICGSFYFVYDNRNRIAFAQDVNLRERKKGEWYAYMYDGLDRMLITALYKNENATRESLQALMDQATGNTTVTIKTPAPKDLYVYYDEGKSSYMASNSITFMPGFESGTSFEINAEVNAGAIEVTENIIINNAALGITGYEPLVVYYYDNYSWSGTHAFDRDYVLSAGNNPYAEPVTAPSRNVYNKVTGYKVAVPGKQEWLKHTIFYDDKGRTLQEVATNLTGGIDVTTNLYDYAGAMLSQYKRISNPLSVSDPALYIQTNYEYDESGNLKQKYHAVSKTSAIQTKLVADYTYDDLNRIKTMTIGGGLEVLKFDYDLLGRLKGINKDYVRNKAAGGYFGLELFFDEGYANKKLDGNLSGVMWRRKGNSDAAHSYGYSYDEQIRLTKADYTQNTSGNWNNNSEDYTLTNAQYDEGDNMLKMKEEGMLPGKVKTTIDDLTYEYKANSYKLLRATDPQGDKHVSDFKNYSGRVGDDYLYDVAGNVIGDKNRGITISYDYLIGNPDKIVFNDNANKYIQYIRAITGQLLQRIKKNDASTDTYTYLGEALYKNNVLEYVSFGEGRARVSSSVPSTFIYDYYIKDHLGNIRTVITEETNQLAYRATHEDNPVPVPPAPERELFSFPSNVDNIPVGNKFYDYNGTSNRKFIRLNYADANRRIGTGKVLRVMSGDQVDLGVLSYYQTNSAANNTPNQIVSDILNQLVSVLLGPASVVPNDKGNLLEGINGVILNQQDFSTFVQNNQTQNPPSTVPRAYLNYVLFDDNFEIVSGSALRVNQPGEVAPLTSQVNVGKNGYLYVYLSNESNTDVFFDDLVIKHTTGHLLQENSYYPFGLQIAGLSSEALNRMQNNYLYNGMEKISDFDLELYDAFYRTFDPQLGRWLQIDPMEEKYAGISGYNSNFNNPANWTDPLGDEPGPPWWLKWLLKGITLPEVVVRPESTVSLEQPMQFITDDFIDFTAQEVLARVKIYDRGAPRDNTQVPNLRPIPTKPPPPLPQVDIPKISASDPCIGCQEILNERGREAEMVKKMFTTPQGQSYLVVRSALETAAWEYGTFKVMAGIKWAAAGIVTRVQAQQLWREIVIVSEAEINAARVAETVGEPSGRNLGRFNDILGMAKVNGKDMELAAVKTREFAKGIDRKFVRDLRYVQRIPKESLESYRKDLIEAIELFKTMTDKTTGLPKNTSVQEARLETLNKILELW
jgi:RHS repeat-associated protein